MRLAKAFQCGFGDQDLSAAFDLFKLCSFLGFQPFLADLEQPYDLFIDNQLRMVAVGHRSDREFWLPRRSDFADEDEVERRRGVDPHVPGFGGRSSIAVLPFVNMSSDQDQEYFADGLTEEILNSLAKTPDLLVAARQAQHRLGLLT